MASKNEVSYRTEQSGFCVFGANSLSKFVYTLKNQIEGAKRGDDIEYVHQLRVASRRIRATMSIFKPCFPKKNFKHWESEVRNITRSLGIARDTDVQIFFVENYLKNVRSQATRFGVEYLLAKHRERRMVMQPRVISTLEQLLISQVLDEMIAQCNTVLSQCASAEAGSLRSVGVLREAQRHILKRLRNFLDMKDCVHKEDAFLLHHEMRIAAKHLRYTMEIFGTLYEDNLKQYVSVMKQFQDVLGEMHDCDVWIEYIPLFIETIKKEQVASEKKDLDVVSVEKALQVFLDHVKKRRHLLYSNFVSIWDANMKQKTFDHLSEQISIIMLSVADSYQKIAIVADHHANLHALTAVITDAKKHGATMFLNVGDFVGFGAFPSEVVSLLHTEDVLSVIGNYDQDVLSLIKKEKKKTKNKDEKFLSLAYACNHLSKTDVSFLRSLPQELRLKISDIRLLVTHGSPNSIDEHLRLNTPIDHMRSIAQTSSADVIIVGHSHQPFVRTVDGVTFVNPGSVGRPDDGNPLASYALMTMNPFSVELLRVSYDVDAAVDAIRKHHLPERFAQMFLHGVSLEAIEKLESKRLQESSRSKTSRLKHVERFAENFARDLTHPYQVKKLALHLFDALKDICSLNEDDRFMLECAAILHDIGWSQGWKGHHKTSLRFILNDTALPFTIREKYIVGSIARYHRKTLPQQAHYHFAALSFDDQRRVEILSAIMRLADAFDASHHSVVKTVAVHIERDEITIRCVPEGNTELEEHAIDKKKSLFEAVFKRRLVVLWSRK